MPRISRAIPALVAGMVLAWASPALAATSSTLSLYSEGRMAIGGGEQRAFDPASSTMRMYGKAADFHVTVSGTNGDLFDLRFAAPTGHTLHRGLYADAQRAPFQPDGLAGISIAGNGDGCNREYGSFDIKDIAVGSTGVVTSAWITFEQHCGVPDGPVVHGELRYRRTRPAGAALAVPATIAWPETAPGGTRGPVPVTFVNESSAPVTIGRAALAGPDAADYAIAGNGCAAGPVPAGGRCQIAVRFTPKIAGPRLARLTAFDGTGRLYTAVLDGTGAFGRTRVVLTGDPGNWLLDGRTATWTGWRDSIGAFRDGDAVLAEADGADGSDASAYFAPAPGQLLAPGQYAGATSDRSTSRTGPALDVTTTGRGCTADGEFTISRLAYRRSGLLKTFSASFTQHCRESSAALRGTVEYHVPFGDATPPAPVSGLSATRTDGRISVKWTNPANTDFARAIVRLLTGPVAPGSPVSGRYVASTAGTTAGFATGLASSVAVFAVDTSGNVSRRAAVYVP